jgi:uncharacterized UBP type Zn finger protein
MRIFQSSSEHFSLKKMILWCNKKRKGWMKSCLTFAMTLFLLITQTTCYSRYFPLLISFMLKNQRARSLNNDTESSRLHSSSISGPSGVDSLTSTRIPQVEIKEMTSFSSFNNKKPFYLPYGLKNLRNTCYLNSVLQSLYLLKAYSSRLKISDWRWKRNSLGVDLINLFDEITKKTLSTKPITDFSIESLEAGKAYGKSAIAPTAVVDKLKINICEQEDAEELLLNVLNKVDESIAPRSVPASSSSAGAPSSTSTVTAPPTFLPSDVFQLQLNQLIYDIEHENHLASNKTLKYFDLSLSIDSALLGKEKEKSSTLMECISHYFEIEYFLGKNGYQCSKHGLTNAKKLLKILSFPKVLVVHLKRFSFDPETYQMKKVRFVFFFFSFFLPSLSPFRVFDIDNDTYRDTTSSGFKFICNEKRRFY